MDGLIDSGSIGIASGICRDLPTIFTMGIGKEGAMVITYSLRMILTST